MPLTPTEIRERLDGVVSRERKKDFPVHSIWMGVVGFPCERRMFYEFTAWDKREPMPMIAYYRMREGKRHEEAAKGDLADAGYYWERAQQHLYIHELKLSGKVDGWLHDQSTGDKMMGEIKSVEGGMFDRLTQATDFNVSAYYQTYLPQCTSYMRAGNESRIMLIVRNRGSGEMKFFPYEFDPDLWGRLEQKCKRVLNAVELSAIPMRIDGVGRMDVCRMCPFKNHCLPDFKPGEAITLIEDDALIIGISKYLELKETLDVEYKVMKKRADMMWATLKERLNGIENAVIGNKYLITGHTTPSGGWKTSIQNLACLEKQNGED